MKETKSDIILTDAALQFFFGDMAKKKPKRKPLAFIPKPINFSEFGKGIDAEDPIEFGAEDPQLEGAFSESHFLFILKTLPKDRYRVIALLLFMKKEMGYNYTYNDIADIWGVSSENVIQTAKRMRQSLIDKGIKP